MEASLLSLAKSIYHLSHSLLFPFFFFFFFFILPLYHILQNIQSSVVFIIHKMTTKNILQEKRLPTVGEFNIASQAKEMLLRF